MYLCEPYGHHAGDSVGGEEVPLLLLTASAAQLLEHRSLDLRLRPVVVDIEMLLRTFLQNYYPTSL